MDAGGFKAVDEIHLFKPKDAYRMPGGGGFNLPATATVGKNPASGVVVYYSLKAKPTTDRGARDFRCATASQFASSRSARRDPGESGGGSSAGAGEQPAAPAGEEGEVSAGAAPARLTTDVGLNRFVWDLRYAEAVRFPGMILWAGETRGPTRSCLELIK